MGPAAEEEPGHVNSWIHILIHSEAPTAESLDVTLDLRSL